MAVGVDHDLSTLRRRAPHRRRGGRHRVVCDDRRSATPNAMDTTTGNTVPQALNPGIAFGTGFSDGGPGRLARTDPLLFNGGGATRDRSAARSSTTTRCGSSSRPRFPAGASVPTSCHKSVFTDVYGGNLSRPAGQRRAGCSRPSSAPERMRLLLQRCFTHYNGLAWNANGAIAGPGDPTACPQRRAAPTRCSAGTRPPTTSPTSSTSSTPSRFGYVPQMTEDFPNGNKTVHILTFRADLPPAAPRCLQRQHLRHGLRAGLRDQQARAYRRTPRRSPPSSSRATMLPNGLARPTPRSRSARTGS